MTCVTTCAQAFDYLSERVDLNCTHVLVARFMYGISPTYMVCVMCLYLFPLLTSQDCIIFGADTIDPPEIRAAELAAGTTPLGIGAGSVLKRAVVDSNARIGRNCKLTNAEGVMHGANTRLPAGVVIRDGLLVVMRDAALPPGTVV